MKTRKFAASGATAALCAMGSAAYAQRVPATTSVPVVGKPAPDQTGDIVVTAQLRKESGQKVPVSVTAIGGDQLARSNVSSLQDLSGSVPSVVVSKSVSYGLAPIAIRGLGGPAGGGSLFTDQPVAVYVDGVYVPALGQSVSDFLDVDTLQVLRGPQGTLYGRNSTAGAILISGKRPSLDKVNGFITGQYASFDDFKISGALNIPLVADTLGLRVAASRNSGGDWARNTVDSRRFGGSDSTNVRGTLRWKPSPDATIDLIVDHSDGDSRPATLALSTIAPAFRGPTLGTVYVGDPYVRRVDFDTALNSRNVQIVGQQFTKTRSTDVTLYADIGLGSMTLTSISGYRNFKVNGTQEVTPASTPAVSTNTNNTVQQQESYSQELRLASAGSGPFKWTLGAYYFHQNTNSFINIISLQGGAPVATGFGPTGPNFVGKPSGTTALFQGTQKVDSIALFADATYDITPQFSVTGGIRYSRDHKDATINNNVSTITPTVLAGPVLAAGTCPSATLTCIRSYENVSPRAVLTFKPTDHNMLYASFSKGFNSGGFNNFGNTAVPTDPTNPLENSSENITSYEIGTKNDFFDRALRLNLSIFQTDYNQLHIRQAVLTGGVAIVNVPRARVRGIELESIIRPVRGLTLTLNGSYLDGKILEGQLSSLPTSTGVIILGQNQTVTNENVAGNRLTRSPKFQGFAQLAYMFDAGAVRITPSATLRGQTKIYYLETNQTSNQYVADGWSEVDLRFGIADSQYKWDVALFGRNVFNKRSISQIVPFTGFPIATLNSPATWGANATFRF